MPTTSTGIIDILFGPGLSKMSSFLDENGPYTGSVTLEHFHLTTSGGTADWLTSQSFGVLVQLNGPISPGLKFVPGYVSDDTLIDQAFWFTRLYQIVVQHQLGDGSWVVTQVVDGHTFPRFVLWEEALPGRIGVHTIPGISVDLFALMLTGL